MGGRETRLPGFWNLGDTVGQWKTWILFPFTRIHVCSREHLCLMRAARAPALVKGLGGEGTSCSTQTQGGGGSLPLEGTSCQRLVGGWWVPCGRSRVSAVCVLVHPLSPSSHSGPFQLHREHQGGRRPFHLDNPRLSGALAWLRCFSSGSSWTDFSNNFIASVGRITRVCPHTRQHNGGKALDVLK